MGSSYLTALRIRREPNSSMLFAGGEPTPISSDASFEGSDRAAAIGSTARRGL